MTGTPFDRRPSDAVRAEINRRAGVYLFVATEDAHAAELARWARDDSAPFPDRHAIRARLEEELLVLCRGLGTWAAAPPTTFFAAIDQRIRDDEEKRRYGLWDW